MLSQPTLPPSLMTLLARLRPCFTAPMFTTFCALVGGILAQTGRRTVTGMLVGSGLSRVWSHDRAHTFFSGARWSADELGRALARLVVAVLVPADATITVIIDDTLFHRRGPNVWAASWFHDGSAKSTEKVGYGNNWVIVGIVVRLPMLDRPVCLPVTARLVRKDTTSASRLWLARQAVDSLATALPGCTLHVVADAAYAGKELCGLPTRITWTTRLRKDAALFAPTPPRTGKPGRPRKKGDRLPTFTQLAATATFTPTEVRRNGQTTVIHIATTTCLWYGVFGAQPVTVVLVRERPTTRRGYDIALVTTDITATAAHTVERYAARWSVKVTIEEAKQLFGIGQAHNRKARAVARTVPFGLACQTLTVVWYAAAGHHPDDVTDHRARAPWYRTKRHPSTADIHAKLRRVLITTRFRPTQPEQPTPAELHVIRLAWDTAAA